MRLELKIPYENFDKYIIEKYLISFKNLSKHHPSRYINSIYFDNENLQIARDNIDGKSQRSKIRVRYYGKKNFSDCFLEIKKKNNKFGTKKIIKLEKKVNEIDFFNLFSLKNKIYKELITEPFIQKYIVRDFLVPSLKVSYMRDYFIKDDIRITHDKNIKYSSFLLNKNIVAKEFVDTHSVIEVKFDYSNLNKALNILDNIPIKPKRYSKYLRGLSFFNKAIYF